MVYGELIEAGAGLLGGYLSSRSEKKAQKKAQKYSDQEKAAAFKYLNEVGARDAFGAQLQRSQLLAGQRRGLEGFQGARQALTAGGTAARQTALARGKQGQADVEQSLVSRGLLGTSTGAQTFQGVGDQTTAQLQNIDFQLAQAFADLGLEEAQTRERQGQELAGFASDERQRQLELGYALAELAPRGYGLPKKAPRTAGERPANAHLRGSFGAPTYLTR